MIVTCEFLSIFVFDFSLLTIFNRKHILFYLHFGNSFKELFHIVIAVHVFICLENYQIYQIGVFCTYMAMLVCWWKTYSSVIFSTLRSNLIILAYSPFKFVRIYFILSSTFNANSLFPYNHAYQIFFWCSNM